MRPMDGIELGARFSLATSRLQYCGPDGADRTLDRAIGEPSARPAARAALERFEALMPYLETIAGAHGLDPFDRRVTEAYWIGNELLDGLGRPEFRTLLETLRRRGLPRSTAERLLAHLPREPLLHHLFHVAFVGVGNVTGHVPTTLANMEACRPGWGRVTEVDPARMLLLAPTLVRDGSRLGWGTERSVLLPRDPGRFPELTVGAPVAFHWGMAALRLTARQHRLLAGYSARALAAANEALPLLGVFDGDPGLPADRPG